MDKLKNHWEKKVTKNHKHFVKHMPKKKIVDHLNRLKEHVIEQVNMSEVKWALDWGCGGGLLAKELGKHCKIIIADISEESLEEAHNYIRHTPKPGSGPMHISLLVGDDPSKVEVGPPKVDLILCYSVIQHFPSAEYWHKVAAKWNEFNPRYIAAQVKLGAKVKETSNYFGGYNYLNGLHVTKKEIEGRFPRYKVTYWKESIAPASGQKIAFFVLDRGSA